MSRKGNKSELLTRIEHLNPEGNWIVEYKQSQEEKSDKSSEPTRDSADETAIPVNGFNDKKQIWDAMQAQIAALPLQLQQKEAAAVVNPTAGTSGGVRLSSSRSSDVLMGSSIRVCSRVSIYVINELMGTFDGSGQNFES